MDSFSVNIGNRKIEDVIVGILKLAESKPWNDCIRICFYGEGVHGTDFEDILKAVKNEEELCSYKLKRNYLAKACYGPVNSSKNCVSRHVLRIGIRRDADHQFNNVNDSVGLTFTKLSKKIFHKFDESCL